MQYFSFLKTVAPTKNLTKTGTTGTSNRIVIAQSDDHDDDDIQWEVFYFLI
jgi:hypothetical protein